MIGSTQQVLDDQGPRRGRQDSSASSTDLESAATATPVASSSWRHGQGGGRKRSPTDDPSKRFVCTVCGRRFRRQDALTRHYRSLHAHGRPFECDICGYKFSRSDNLAVHQRAVHRAGTEQQMRPSELGEASWREEAENGDVEAEEDDEDDA